MRFDAAWCSAIRERIAAVDFSTPDARRGFADALRRDYTLRELNLYKACVDSGHGGDFGARTREGNRHARSFWDAALEEAATLVSKIRALRGEATTFGGCAFEDAPDGLMDLTICALRTIASDAAKGNADRQAIVERLIAHGRTLDTIDRNTRPKAAQSDNAPTRPRIKPRHSITYKQALAVLKRMNCPKDRKTLQRWLKGKNTPAGFTPEKMASVEAFTAWVTVFAEREQARINYNGGLRIDNPKNRKMQKFK